MPTRTINLSDEAYSRLSSLKKEGESFSEVVNRITGKFAVADLIGVLGRGRAEALRRAVKDVSGRLGAGLDRVAARLGEGSLPREPGRARRRSR